MITDGYPAVVFLFIFRRSRRVQLQQPAWKNAMMASEGTPSALPVTVKADEHDFRKIPFFGLEDRSLVWELGVTACTQAGLEGPLN